MESSIKTKKQKEMPELRPEIEEKIRAIESGKVSGKKYTPGEYIKHIKKVLED
ncbi:hypothetical protein DYY66_2199 [Candidatus Nitrosotalea sp. FS]|uniref:hypothetical protein n=1 Tax=Candidatus Nitrosotalea sp. FS TaxID=2341021 RepID=UPI001407E8E8|nr:hypothetical protein [Candidatus Nitrosotalea sp. FS]NHH97642.1 hypothetical protein [Candidatus Nitrosotalea sp. FS]